MQDTGDPKPPSSESLVDQIVHNMFKIPNGISDIPPGIRDTIAYVIKYRIEERTGIPHGTIKGFDA